jgi:hypothetical protein
MYNFRLQQPNFILELNKQFYTSLKRCSLTQRQSNAMSESNVLMIISWSNKGEITAGQRQLYNEELHKLYLHLISLGIFSITWM